MSYSITTHCVPPLRDDKPLMLTIGGSDSAAMAGVQMDGRSAEALGVHASVVVTAVTAQGNDAFMALNPVGIVQLESQLIIALNQKPAAIKIGMLANAEQARLVASMLAEVKVPIVYDPVLAATSEGNKVVDELLLVAIKQRLLPLCTLVTPNFSEAQKLTGSASHDAWALVGAMQQLGCQWLQLKGGHEPLGQHNQQQVVDYIASPDQRFSLSQPRLATRHTRGTGCALASSIAALLAIGYELRDALVIAKMIMQEAMLNAKAVNGGQGCVLPQGFPRDHWPLYAEPDKPHWQQLSFPSCVADEEAIDLGLYPIFESAAWLARILPEGISTAQLRVKHLQGDALREEIQQAVDIAKAHNCRLFINDYWQLAIDAGAYGVHLGQEDLEDADLLAISQAGLRLGISNHCHFEVARALAIKPSYIACGPIYATTTKQMPWVPYGLSGLEYWCAAIKGYPLVAIAGIDATSIEPIAATGVSGIALITAITKADAPEVTAKQLQGLVHASRPEEHRYD